MKKSLILIAIALGVVVVIAAACGSKSATDGSVPTGKVIKTVPVGNLTATFSSDTGQLKKGDQEVMLAFTDSSGKSVDVGAVSLNFHMPAMGTMAVMNNAATLTTTGTPGVYSGNVDLEMSGEWQAQISYQGPAGTGKANLPVTAQ